MKSYLIYHPKREKTEINKITVYHDKFGGNEDPYIWNYNFLHTFCHITQLSNEIGQINFWVSDESLHNLHHLYCDCVFVIKEKIFWKNSNSIYKTDKTIDNLQAYEHHYKWGNKEVSSHELKKRMRYTLKADPAKSFQPQTKKRELIDILPFLEQNGIAKDEIEKSIIAVVGSRPMKLPNDLGEKLYEYLNKISKIKLYGKDLKNLHPNSVSTNKLDCGKRQNTKVGKCL
jgi:hypothetical protein